MWAAIIIRLLSPILVIPPPPSVPLLIVACSLIILLLPISNFVGSPWYFKSCGLVPIEANGKICVLLPIIVFPVIFTWDIIFAPEPVDVGHYKGICSSSVWTWNLNLFSVNENLVALEEHQHPTRKLLEARGIECAMLPMRHARTLGGCFHWVTLDLERG